MCIRTHSSGRDEEELCNASVTVVRDLRSETLIRGGWGVQLRERNLTQRALYLHSLQMSRLMSEVPEKQIKLHSGVD